MVNSPLLYSLSRSLDWLWSFLIITISIKKTKNLQLVKMQNIPMAWTVNKRTQATWLIISCSPRAGLLGSLLLSVYGERFSVDIIINTVGIPYEYDETADICLPRFTYISEFHTNIKTCMKAVIFLCHVFQDLL